MTGLMLLAVCPCVYVHHVMDYFFNTCQECCDVYFCISVALVRLALARSSYWSMQGFPLIRTSARLDSSVTPSGVVSLGCVQPRDVI